MRVVGADWNKEDLVKVENLRRKRSTCRVTIVDRDVSELNVL